MSEEKRFRATEWITVLLVALASFYLGDHIGKNSLEAQDPEILRDTTTKIVTVYKDFPDPVKTVAAGRMAVPRYLFWTDTTSVEVPGPTEYVYLPSEQQYYEEEDGKLRIWISGYHPNLDRYEIDWLTTTITETKTYKPPNKRWGIGITAGYGAVVTDKTVRLAPYVGVGITYNILQW
jgi:hypothetical protein